jgi:hypothetical protein
VIHEDPGMLTEVQEDPKHSQGYRKGKKFSNQPYQKFNKMASL